MRGRAAVLVPLVAIWVGARLEAGPRPTGEKGSDPNAERNAPAEPDNPWARARVPSAGPARSVGGYSSGCLAGAARLPLQGRGFRVAEPERRRFFAHPALVDFIRQFGREVQAAGLGVLPIGDLSQPRGGPAPSGHSSHQTGLDADIWYANGAGHGRWPPKKVAMVDLEHLQPTGAFDRRVARVLALAAADQRVDRIFVNPVIKRELCARAGNQRGWLHKLRPWWLHHEHFHVRLVCPAGSPDCRPQSPLPEGDGCREVDWWLQPRAEVERSEKRKEYRARQGVVPVLPAPCGELVPR